MEFLLFWFAFAVAVGMFATKRGRGSGNWFLISVVFSPLLGFIFLLVSEDLSKKASSTDNGLRVKCPACAELVLAEASVCKHCGAKLDPNIGYTRQLQEAHAKEKLREDAKSQIQLAVAIVVVLGGVYFCASKI